LIIYLLLLNFPHFSISLNRLITWFSPRGQEKLPRSSSIDSMVDIVWGNENELPLPKHMTAQEATNRRESMLSPRRTKQSRGINCKCYSHIIYTHLWNLIWNIHFDYVGFYYNNNYISIWLSSMYPYTFREKKMKRKKKIRWYNLWKNKATCITENKKMRKQRSKCKYLSSISFFPSLL